MMCDRIMGGADSRANDHPPLTTQPLEPVAMADQTLLPFARAEKRCTMCGVVKAVSEFNKSRGKPRGECKVCHTASVVKWQRDNKEKYRERHKKWRDENPDRVKEHARKAWKNSTPEMRARKNERTKKLLMKSKYGLTPELWKAMYERQGGVCAICRIPGKTGRHGKLVVDHCHATGRVRGLLCSPCNVSIGLMEESPQIMSAAISYLQANQEAAAA